jgi:4-hydroxybenzoate polyprenyltransferase
VDRDDDVRIGIRTSALTFGRYDVLAVGICYALYLAGMAWVGVATRLGAIYFAAVGVAALIAAYHVWLIRGRDRMRCFRAFLHNHWLGFALFAGIVLDYAIRLRIWPRAW